MEALLLTLIGLVIFGLLYKSINSNVVRKQQADRELKFWTNNKYSIVPNSKKPCS